VPQVTDQRLTLSAPITVPANATQARLTFWHRYSLEAVGPVTYDGGVLEFSRDSIIWFDTPFILGGYNRTVLNDPCSRQNPLAGRQVWSGDSGGWQQAMVDLMPYRGQSVWFRFRLGTDETGVAPGWWVDDISVVFNQAFCFTPTATPTATALTSTPTASYTPSITGTLSPTPSLSATLTRVPSGTPTATNSVVSSGTPTPTDTASGTPSPGYTPTVRASVTITRDVSRTATGTPGGATQTPNQVPSSTATPCPMRFTDVGPDEFFYAAVRYLYCAGIVSGYADNTYRPYANTTRGQLCKIVVLAEGWPLYTPSTPTFRDVRPVDTFYDVIETAYQRGIISGYECGVGCLEFRLGNNVTRAQLCKIVVMARGWEIDTTGGPHFVDVPVGDTFYAVIETAYSHHVISGYDDRTFRPGNSATRGQIAKIVYLAITGP
ncbi:MAG: S-layer homology domain-containing protein, partial [Chloroflexia bacterium]